MVSFSYFCSPIETRKQYINPFPYLSIRLKKKNIIRDMSFFLFVQMYIAFTLDNPWILLCSKMRLLFEVISFRDNWNWIDLSLLPWRLIECSFNSCYLSFDSRLFPYCYSAHSSLGTIKYTVFYILDYLLQYIQITPCIVLWIY